MVITMPALVRSAAALAVLTTLATRELAAFPQGDASRTPVVDPYTKGDAATLRTAGYEGLGPFVFGSNHSTDDIEALLPEEPLRWVETAHFRIGSALPAVAVTGEKAWLAKLRGDLERLAKRVPGVKVDTKVLDPWLRLHLVALAAEELYTAVLADLGRRDVEFPSAPGHNARDAARFLGLGPYLGQPEKFTILLLRKSASLARYTAAHHGWASANPVRRHDHKFGSAFFGAAEECCGGKLAVDEALRTHLAFHVANNLYTSYRCYGHNLPGWLVTGLSHEHARRVSTRFPIYDLRTGPGSEPSCYPLWDKRWAEKLALRELEPLATFLERMDVEAFTMDDHMQSWALAHWLLTTRREALMRFLHEMKAPFHERMRFPTEPELFARQQELLRKVFATDAAGLEELWRRQVGRVSVNSVAVKSRRER